MTGEERDEQVGPAADELTDAQVSAIHGARDEAELRWAEIVARDPSVKAAMTGVYADELGACVELVRDAYAAAGVSAARAKQAAETWIIVRAGVREDLAFGDQVLDDFRTGKLRRGGGLGAP